MCDTQTVDKIVAGKLIMQTDIILHSSNLEENWYIDRVLETHLGRWAVINIVKCEIIISVSSHCLMAMNLLY